MIRLDLLKTCAILFAVLATASAPAETNLAWEELPPLPEPRSGHFAGVHNDALIVAGGSDFLVSPFQGGEKQWYGDIFVLPRGADEWIRAGELSHARAYGVSIEGESGLYLIGGSDGDSHYATTVRVSWDGNAIAIEEDALPPFDETLAYMGGARVGDVIHLVGGQPEALSQEAFARHWQLDLSVESPSWAVTDWNADARILPVVSVQENRLYVFSGAEISPAPNGVSRRYLSDGHAFSDGEWTEVTGPPTPVVAAAVLPAGTSHIFVFSGDTGEHAARTQELGDDHPGFPATIYAYHTITDTWTAVAEAPAALVTTMAVKWDGQYVIPAGEDRPGHRSARVHIGTLSPSEGNFSAIDYGVIAIYFIALIGMGAYFSRREKSTEAFFLGGRRIPWWAVGISLFGTSLSAITYLTIPARAYSSDWILVLNQYGVIFFAPFVVWYFIPKFRENPIDTAYAFLENRFGVLLRIYGSLNFALFQVGRMSIVMFLPALAMSAATGIDIKLAIVTMGVISTVYTVLGGIEAVIWTDVLQTIVLTIGAIIGFFIVFMNVEMGVGEAISTAAAAGKFRSFDWSFNFVDATVWVILIGSTLSNAYPITADQTMVQRYLTTPDAKGAGRALWIHAWLAIPASFLFFGLGTALWIYFREHPEVLDPALLNDATLPLFVVHEFPAGLKGLIIAGVFAATMSSLDSSINSLSSVTVNDYYRRFSSGATEESSLRLARVLTVIFGTIGTIGAIYLSSIETRSLFSNFLTFLNLVGGGVAGVFALGVFTKIGNSIGAFVGAVVSACLVVYVWQYTPLNSLAYGAVGFTTSLAVGYVVSRFTARSS